MTICSLTVSRSALNSSGQNEKAPLQDGTCMGAFSW
jgi:hypothetical protein